MATDDLVSLADRWLQQGDWDVAAAFLADQPPHELARQPALLRLRGHILWRQQTRTDAFTTLERACQFAAEQGDWPLAVECALDQARWYQSKEDVQSASAHLERARRYAEAIGDADLDVQAKLALAIGRLAPNLEQAELGVEWCARALALYEKLGDSAGQVDALWNLAASNTYTGRLLEASSQAQRALHLHQVAGLDPLRRLYLLNLVACLALYWGDTEAGLKTIRDAESLAVQHPNTKPALYLADTEADLFRVVGSSCQAWFSISRSRIQEPNNRSDPRVQDSASTPRHAASHRRRDRSRAGAGRRQPRADRPLREEDPGHAGARLGRGRGTCGGVVIICP